MPYFQTLGALVNSIILVLIALDRYVAIKRLHKSPWEPSKPFCVGCCLAVWILAAAVSSPIVKVYDYYNVIVIPDDTLKTKAVDGQSFEYYIGSMCGRCQVILRLVNFVVVF